MLILVTGTPGAGKSLYAVSELLNKQFKDRPLFVHNIKDLLIPHTLLSADDVMNWHEGGMPVVDGVVDPSTGEIVKVSRPSFEVKNAVICVDEVQHLARPRAASAPAPEWIKRLEVHRHSGCDFVLITQHPGQIDAHIRRLVGRHIHVRRTFALKAAVVYEWDSCNNSLALKGAQSKLWRYNKKAFALYHSSELHTKAGGKVPLVVWVVLAAMLAFPFVGWQATKRVLSRFTGSGAEAVDVTQKGVAPASPGGANRVGSSGGGVGQAAKVMTAEEWVAQYQPRVVGLMHSAPAYDKFTEAKFAPLPAACIQSKRPSWVKAHGGSCGCFTQTGTPYDTSQEMCVKFVRNEVFFPFLDAPGSQAAVLPAAKPAPQPVTASVRGEPQFPLSTVVEPPKVAQLDPNAANDLEARQFMRRRSVSQ